MSGPTTWPCTERKFRNALSRLSASTVIFPLSPTCTVCTSKSALIGGRETLRTTCAQNLATSLEPTQFAAHLLCASLVHTTALPRPVCQFASSGSVAAIFPPTSGVSICGFGFLLVSTYPNTGGKLLIPLIRSLDDGPVR